MTKMEINNINSWEVIPEDTTPVMRQYLEIKRENPNMLLLYRLGDFYETFFEDALKLSKALELTLTSKDAGDLGRIPLAGIPAKAADTYIEKLVQKNIKVAICEQLEDPKYTKDLVKRGVTRIITAGTIVESNFLEQNTNNYICAMYNDEKNGLYGFAYTDISTGEFKVTQASLDLIIAELARLNPAEIIAPSIREEIKPFQIVPDEKIDLPENITKIYNCSKIPPSVFEPAFAESNLKAVFETKSLEAFGYASCKSGFRAAGALLSYIWETQKGNMPKFERIEHYELSEYMLIDVNTRKNLELTETMREKNKYGSLLWSIDKTRTNMGARLLRSRICQPLKKVEDIQKRQDAVSELVEKGTLRRELSIKLEKIQDIQRLSTRISNSSATPRDFIGLKTSLQALPEILDIAKNLDNNPFEKIENYRQDISIYADLIEKTIIDNPPVHIKEGGIIKDNVNGELDYFRDLLTGEKNGSKNLKKPNEKKPELRI